MPDTYTKEQIAEVIETLKKCTEIEGRYETGPYRCRQPTLGGYVYVTKGIYTIPLTKERDVILSALSTAEQERDALAARCAELEARLQGAADRAVAWCDKNLLDIPDSQNPPCFDRYAAAELRATIVGEKKEGA